MWMPLIAALVALAQTPAPREVRVTVVQDGKPVAGAEVRWYEGVVRYDDEDLGRIDELAIAAGNKATADGEGRATLSVRSLPATLVASTQGGWGWSEVSGTRSDWELALETDGDLLVDIVDPEGKPAGGVPLVLQVRYGTRPPRRVGEARSDRATGRAVFRHARCARLGRSFRLFDSARVGESKEGDAPKVAVAVNAEGVDEYFTLLSANEFPSEPLRLTIPGFAEVDVTVTDEGGASRAGIERAYLVPYVGDTWPRSGPWRSPRPSARLDGRVAVAEFHDGHALFDRVVAGCDVGAVVFCNDASVAWDVRVPGPLAAGTRTQVAVQLGAGTRAVSAQLVHDGALLSSSAVTVQRFHPAPPRSLLRFSEEKRLGDGTDEFTTGDSVATDTDGVLRIDIETNPYLRSIRLTAHSGLDGLLEAWIDVRDKGAGRHELGGVEMRAAPMALQGSVVNDGGEPIEGAVIEVSCASYDEATFRLLSGAGGRFELRTFAPSDFRIRADARGLVAGNVGPLPHGTSGLRVVLRRLADVRGYLRMDKGRATEGLMILLLRVDETDDPALAPGTSSYCACDGKFEFPGVVSGKYLLQVKESGADGKQKLVFSRSGIQVAGGQTTDLGEIVIP